MTSGALILSDEEAVKRTFDNSRTNIHTSQAKLLLILRDCRSAAVGSVKLRERHIEN